ncbi:hypothetical protein [Actinomarinicola tropica]|uniref:Uncharacterized protein n=1 Tax=Actinomarinicola tropica TaxID=2789776 RepID=A0A5Q2RPN7_9ACTN|nr:hypothetical protein [Actinomarinicola tropica]QGG96406.1 hypothetical protein GH723_15585 [Actinomarinicola tropica]
MAAAVVVALGSTACLGGESEACESLREIPPGIEEITTQGGDRTERATWFAILTSGVVAAEPDSRAQMAAAVSADRDGYERITDAVEGLDAELALLHQAASDPERGVTMSSAPDTLAAVTELSAFVGEECDG